MTKPRIYTASKVRYAPMWRNLAKRYANTFYFQSSWIEMENLDDTNREMCRDGWIANIIDVNNSDHLVCFAEPDDELSGTLIEIGAALSGSKPVHLVGSNHRWKTWVHHPLVLADYETIEGALLAILQLRNNT